MSYGKLIVGGVDIGNVNDISNRLRNSLLSSDVVVVESLHRFKDKCKDLNISINAVVLEIDSNNQKNEGVLQFIERSFRDNKSVLLTCSDGMPGICDPGYSIVKMALLLDVDVSVIPGPSIVSALPSISGFNYSSFIFQDSLSLNSLVRRRELEIAKTSHRAFLFVIPDRVEGNLAILDIIKDIELIYGSDAEVAIGINITGPKESLFVGKINEAESFINSITIDASSNVSFFIDRSVA